MRETEKLGFVIGVERGEQPPLEVSAYAARREDIVDVAAGLFALRGYDSTGVADIATACGLAGRGSLYHYIGSKEQILVQIAFSVLGPLADQARRIAASTRANPLVKLRLISETFLVAMAERPDHVWVYEHDYRFLRGDARADFLELREGLGAVVTGLISEATEAGFFGGTDSRLGMFAFFNLHNRTMQWYRQGGSWSPQHLAAEYCRLLFAGLRAEGAPAVDLEAEVLRHRTDQAAESQPPAARAPESAEVRCLVPDSLWEEVAPLLPQRPSRRTRSAGRPPVDDRTALAGIAYALKTGTRWNDLPADAIGCSGVTCWRRLRNWIEAGSWPAVEALLRASLQVNPTAPTRPEESRL